MATMNILRIEEASPFLHATVVFPMKTSRSLETTVVFPMKEVLPSIPKVVLSKQAGIFDSSPRRSSDHYKRYPS
jgi:hypothetical protein